MSWTLCTSAAAIAKAGNFANATIVASGATLAKWSDEAEGELTCYTRYDIITNYSGLATYVKNAISTWCSSKIAQKIIAYDMSGFFSRQAETLLDVLEHECDKVRDLLKDEKYGNFMGVSV